MSEPTRTFLIPTQSGETYSRVELDLDLTHEGWYMPQPDGAHGIFQLTRSQSWGGNLYGFMTLRGPANGNLVRVIANIDLPQGQTTRLQTNKLLDVGVTYHVRYVYDAAGGTRSLLMRGNGQTYVDISGTDVVATVSTLAPGFELILATDLACSGCGPEVPTFGWRYSNVCFRAFL